MAPDPTARAPGTSATQESLTVLVGGVGELYQGDLDLGRLAVERLAGDGFGPHVALEDLYYGAVAVVQRLEETRPHSLVLVGAAMADRPPGTVERRRIKVEQRPTAQVQRAVEDAVTGYVSIAIVVEVASGLGALPPRTVVIEVEPAVTTPAEGLSSLAREGLERALELVRTEVRRAPLFELCDRLRPLCEGDRLEAAPAVVTLRQLLRSVEAFDESSRWGATFARRDRLRRQIESGLTGGGMDVLDWALWWALLEELDRLFAAEAGA